MSQTVDPNRLRQIRASQRLSQDDLAKKAGLNKQTIYRLETGSRPTRKRTLDCLSRALNVDPDVLVGTKPIPAAERLLEEADENTYQVKAPLDAAIRNAFSLVALRYKIPVSRIVELAPLLFVLAAEGSLARRRDKLAEFEKAYETVADLSTGFPHLPVTVALPRGSSEEAIIAEKASITAKDIFADTIPNDIYWVAPDDSEYDESGDNPFVRYLKELAASNVGAASIDALDSRHFMSYQVCRDEAVKLTSGDERLADGILNGWVLIHKIPRDLFKEEAAADRVEWMRPTIEAALKANEEFQKMSPEEQLNALGL